MMLPDNAPVGSFVILFDGAEQEFKVEAKRPDGTVFKQSHKLGVGAEPSFLRYISKKLLRQAIRESGNVEDEQ